MADFREDDSIYPVLLAMLECAELELEKSGLPPVGYASIQPGALPVLDHVGNGKECDEMIINVTNGFPTNGFPIIDQFGTCGSAMAFEVQLGVFRCAPVPAGKLPQNFKLPTPVQQLNATRLHLADMQAMKRALACCLKNYEYVIRTWLPYGPAGGAVGGAWLVAVGGRKDE
jgi:hypothetical protein